MSQSQLVEGSDPLDQHSLPQGTYGYSAAKLDDLGATEYTLVTIANDVSTSVSSFKTDMEQALKQIINACKLSPRADNLMVRFTQFADDLSESHGFKLLSQCNTDDYDDSLNVGGMTALVDAAENAVSATRDYAKQLADNEFDTNAIVFIITDGMENRSTLDVADVQKALNATLKSEYLESIVTILIGVGIQEPEVSAALAKFKDEAGMTQYIECKNADARTLAKLAEFVSQSISAQSSALGSGGPSQPPSLKI